MNRKRRIKIQDFNPHLICVLCGGYFIDATTIIECFHSFCRACIVKYLKSNRFCPVCDVQVHKSKPLQNIRPDTTLQELVYKLVPGLFQNEVHSRREFFAKHPESPICADLVSDYSFIYAPDECFTLTLEYWNPCNDPEVKNGGVNHWNDDSIVCLSKKRYLRCPAAVTIAHLHKLIRAKYGLHASHLVELLFRNELLQDTLTLMDVAYIYKWRRKGPLNLSYRIFESSLKRIKLDSSVVSCLHGSGICEAENVTNNLKQQINKMDFEEKITDWKEVQLQISETGIMSVTGISLENNNNITNSSAKDLTDNHDKLKSESICPKDQSDFLATNNLLPKPTLLPSDSDQTGTLTITKFPVPNLNAADEDRSLNADKHIDKLPITYDANLVIELKGVNDVNNSIELEKQKTKVPEEGVIGCNLPSLTSNLKLDQGKRRGVVLEKVEIGANRSMNLKDDSQVDRHLTNADKMNFPLRSPPQHVSPSHNVKKSSHSNSMGYKTLKVPPKTWNPSITRSSYLNSKSQNISSDADISDSTSSSKPAKATEKAPKFFKMRNMPRYLGNPASGVKPMYQVAGENVFQDSGSTSKTKQVVMKIDPKTLSPIVSVMTSSISTSVSSSPNKSFYSSSSAQSSITKSTNSITNTPITQDSVKSNPNGKNSSAVYRNLNMSASPVCSIKNFHASSAPLSINFPRAASPAPAQSFARSPSDATSNNQFLNSPSYALNPATLNLLSSNLSFLPNASNFLYGTLSNFVPPLLRPGLNMNSISDINANSNLSVVSNSLTSGIGAFHSMPPSINMLFPHHRGIERSGGFATSPSHGHTQTPAIQRIPASKCNNNKKVSKNTQVPSKHNQTHPSSSVSHQIVDHLFPIKTNSLPNYSTNSTDDTNSKHTLDQEESCSPKQVQTNRNNKVTCSIVNENPNINNLAGKKLLQTDISNSNSSDSGSNQISGATCHGTDLIGKQELLVNSRKTEDESRKALVQPLSELVVQSDISASDISEKCTNDNPMTTMNKETPDNRLLELKTNT